MSMRSSCYVTFDGTVNYISGCIIFERAEVVFPPCHTFPMLVFFLKGFLSVPFLPATELSLHQLFSFYSVVVLFSFALPLSVTPQCLVQSSVSSEEQVCSAED